MPSLKIPHVIRRSCVDRAIPRTTRALTIVETVLSSAAIVALLGVLLPAAQLHRGLVVRESRCLRNLRRFGQAMTLYASENSNWIPGVNTSGVALRAVDGTSAIQQADLPVQSYDWMMPLMPYLGQEMPEQRAQRWRVLLDEFRCPEQTNVAALYSSGLSTSIDRADFLAENEPWPAVSYLMPLYFQHWGQDHQGEVIGEHVTGVPLQAYTVPSGWEVAMASYQSRVTEVGSPDRKIMIADGTRYCDTSLMITLDVSTTSSLYGAFTSGGAWWAGTNAYGVKTGTYNWDGRRLAVGSPSSGWNLSLSYRHARATRPEALFASTPVSALENLGCINVACFDGHVETLTDRQSRDFDRWYPSGGIVQIANESLTDVPRGTVVP